MCAAMLRRWPRRRNRRNRPTAPSVPIVRDAVRTCVAPRAPRGGRNAVLRDFTRRSGRPPRGRPGTCRATPARKQPRRRGSRRRPRASGRSEAVLMVSRITPRQVLTRMTKGERIAFVDARPDEAWRASGLRLTGAVRVRLPSMTRDAAQLPSSCLVVVYGSGNDDRDADVPRVADGLRALGFGEVRVLAGGFSGWIDQRYAV